LGDPSRNPEYRLLAEFRRLFKGHVYRHRSSTQGDFVAMHLYEDLYKINRSSRLVRAIRVHESVLNAQNRTRGIKARRGDGTFGEIIPGQKAIADVGFAVARGPIATVEIGVEVKILAKAMIKQIDRVTGDLLKASGAFQTGRPNGHQRRNRRYQSRGAYSRLRKRPSYANHGEGRISASDSRSRRGETPVTWRCRARV
jgi:hypothetical protein